MGDHNEHATLAPGLHGSPHVLGDAVGARVLASASGTDRATPHAAAGWGDGTSYGELCGIDDMPGMSRRDLRTLVEDSNGERRHRSETASGGRSAGLQHV